MSKKNKSALLRGMHKFSLVEYGLYEITIVFFTLSFVKRQPTLLNLTQDTYWVITVLLFITLLYRIKKRSE